MPLGELSRERLATCHPDLQRLIGRASQGIDRGDLGYALIRDITVLCGHRGQAEQDECVRLGHSKSPWPTSKHNRTPSDAVDVIPYPVTWDEHECAVLHAYIVGLALGMGIDLHSISWDMPHIQRDVP